MLASHRAGITQGNETNGALDPPLFDRVSETREWLERRARARRAMNLQGVMCGCSAQAPDLPLHIAQAAHLSFG